MPSIQTLLKEFCIKEDDRSQIEKRAKNLHRVLGAKGLSEKYRIPLSIAKSTDSLSTVSNLSDNNTSSSTQNEEEVSSTDDNIESKKETVSSDKATKKVSEKKRLLSIIMDEINIYKNLINPDAGSEAPSIESIIGTLKKNSSTFYKDRTQVSEVGLQAIVQEFSLSDSKINIEDFIGLYNASLTTFFHGREMGLLFLKDRFVWKLTAHSRPCAMQYKNIDRVEVYTVPFDAEIISKNGSKIRLKGSSYSSDEVVRVFRSIIEYYK